jgi:ketosteroid isomerase-like protein
MQSDTDQQVRELGLQLAEAEQRNAAAALDSLLADDFKLVGPLGFVIDKRQWLDQYRSGALVTRSLAWDDVEVRSYGDVAIAIGRRTQQAEYRGHPANGRFRVTEVAVRRGDRWVVAGLHLSPIADPGMRPQNSPSGEG